MSSTGTAAVPTANGRSRSPGEDGRVVVFICENCGRPGLAPSSGIRRRPRLPEFAWPLPIREVAVPCAGRLQPEHFLKILEDGADAVGVIGCAEGNCHHLEGNRRCGRRLDYVRTLVAETGLAGERLMMFRLPGSAVEDMALGIGAEPIGEPPPGDGIAGIRAAVVAWLEKVPRNPLCHGDLPDEYVSEVENDDASDE